MAITSTIQLSGLLLALLVASTAPFSALSQFSDRHSNGRGYRSIILPSISTTKLPLPSSSRLNLDSKDENNDSPTIMSDSDQLLLGLASTTAGVVTL